MVKKVPEISCWVLQFLAMKNFLCIFMHEKKKNDCMEYLEEGSFNKHYHQGLKGLKTKKQYLSLWKGNR